MATKGNLKRQTKYFSTIAYTETRGEATLRAIISKNLVTTHLPLFRRNGNSQKMTENNRTGFLNDAFLTSRIVQKGGCKFFVFHAVRYDPKLSNIKREGSLGQISF